MLVTLTFAALHINTNLYLCEFADVPTRGRELVFINGTNALVCLKATSRAWMAPICKYVRWASSQTHKSKTLPAEWQRSIKKYYENTNLCQVNGK